MLFNIVLEAVLINIDKRGNISTKMWQTCAYADDISIIARSRDALVERRIYMQWRLRTGEQG
jgi:hypothetical protein